ncbi:hypothetical protein HK098_007230 [Nowakowskiella sp. JEL0407]|nr:hypothetical protein HK098_007230 [Nowakowskiella sp. JEL0407]
MASSSSSSTKRKQPDEDSKPSVYSNPDDPTPPAEKRVLLSPSNTTQTDHDSDSEDFSDEDFFEIPTAAGNDSSELVDAEMPVEVDMQNSEMSNLTSVEISIGGESVVEKPKRDLRYERAVQRVLHKTHLMLLFKCSQIRNNWVNDPELRSIALSLVPTRLNTLTSKSLSLTSLRSLASSFCKIFPSSPLAPLPSSPSSILSQINDTLSAHTPIHPDSKTILFVSQCRALTLQTRLIASLHPIPLSLSIKPPENFYPLRFWTEIYVESEQVWVPIDVSPETPIFNRPLDLEPSGSLKSRTVFSYVIAFDEIFSVKDVTRRYTAKFGAQTLKLRLSSHHHSSSSESSGSSWWDKFIWLFTPATDEISTTSLKESAELDNSQLREKMPTTLVGFKGHPLYVLERHLKSREVLFFDGERKGVGRFKGEYVFARECVKVVRSVREWEKLGYSVLEGCVPVKWEKRRKGKEKMGVDRDESVEGGDVIDEDGDVEMVDEEKKNMVPLFGEWQVEEYRAPNIVDGKIPKNEYGNINVFHPRMIPVGAKQIRGTYVKQAAKTLGFDYAVAVTGFEYLKRKMVPVVDGIIVAEDAADAIKEAAQMIEAEKLEGERTKKRIALREIWKKLLYKYLVKQRLQLKYGK